MGQYHEISPGKGILQDKSFAWGADMSVVLPTHLNAKNGDLVAVQIEDYPESPKGFWGKVIAVLGGIADPLNDSIRVLHGQSIPHEFSKRTLQETKTLPDKVLESEIKGRRDFRDIPIITVDGKTA